MSSNHGALLIFGSGPGIGRNVAALFAERGYKKIILLSRDKSRLSQDAEFVRSASPKASIDVVQFDAADTDNVRQALKTVDESLGGVPVECVLYNPARIGASKFFEFPPETLESDLRISVVSLYTVAQWAIPKLLETAKSSSKTPSFLVTSGMLAKDPFPTLFSLAAGKGGQYNLVHSLHKEFEPKGVHCSVIVVGGYVADESKVTNARNIAEEAWKLFSLPQGKGALETVMEDPAYLEHIRNREKR